MATLHAALAWLAGAATVALVAVAVATATRRTQSYRLLDRTLLVQVAAALVAALTGAATYATVVPPADPLHILYGAVATGLPVAARAAAHGRDAGALGRWVTVAALLAVGATVRSFMTGS